MAPPGPVSYDQQVEVLAYSKADATIPVATEDPQIDGDGTFTIGMVSGGKGTGRQVWHRRSLCRKPMMEAILKQEVEIDYWDEWTQEQHVGMFDPGQASRGLNDQDRAVPGEIRMLQMGDRWSLWTGQEVLRQCPVCADDWVKHIITDCQNESLIEPR